MRWSTTSVPRGTRPDCSALAGATSSGQRAIGRARAVSETISSAPARRETKLAILEHFRNGKLYELYGSTEAGWVTLLRPEEQLERLGTVGREWAGSGPIRLLDPDGREVPDGETGELFSLTPYVFDGYWKNPEKTAEAFRGAWCSVGDMALRDPQGFIHLVDRKSNMIISGGENVYPSEVEGALGAHPKVKDVAVVGLPHARWVGSQHGTAVATGRAAGPGGAVREGVADEAELALRVEHAPVERDDAAAALLLVLGQLVLRMRRQPRIVDTLHRCLLLQP